MGTTEYISILYLIDLQLHESNKRDKEFHPYTVDTNLTEIVIVVEIDKK